MKQIKTDAIAFEFFARPINHIGFVTFHTVPIPKDGVIGEEFVKGVYSEYEYIQKPKLVFLDCEGNRHKRQFHDFYNIGDEEQ